MKNQLEETKVTSAEETKSKPKNFINTFKLKHGAYTIVITAVFLAIIIAFNWLFMALSDKYHWEIDMTPEKVHSMDKDNIKYLKSLKEEVLITVVAASDSEYAQVMKDWAPQYYKVYSGDQYYVQTPELVKKYATYNDNIKVRFLDAQSTEYTDINTKYADLDIVYGDILVTYQLSDKEERIKKIAFDEIYNYDSATYGGTSYVTSNNIENALTNAITYVIGGETKKAVILTGHSKNDNTSNYVSLLKLNGYAVEIISDKKVTKIPEDANIVAVMSPSIDFTEPEILLLSEFLDNGGELNKGFVYFADASSPTLPNLNDFMAEWGINFSEGILFENGNPDPSDASKLTMTLDTAIDTTGMTGGRIEAAYNVPMLTSEPDDTTITVTDLVLTSETTVIAPIGAGSDWKPESKDAQSQYVGVAYAEKLNYDTESEDGRKSRTSYVVAFSSVQFIQSEYAEIQDSNNKDVVLYCTDLAANITEGGVKFITKTITTEWYTDITTSGYYWILGIFVIGLPVVILAIGIYVTIRRKVS